jgi:4-oxalomesaconate tautomerase
MKGPYDGIPCMWMRGGTSKGGFFVASDLPGREHERASLLLGIMGSPDPRQTDGMGGGDPLTSKVAIVERSNREGADVDYLFLQVFVDQPIVTDAQNCGNMLAGVGPFAIERGLVAARDPRTDVGIYMVNSGQTAVATVETPDGRPIYDGTARIDGVPGTAAPVSLAFRETAGSTCGALLPTGNVVDRINGLEVTLIDNGMPVVVVEAAALGVSGYEAREELEANHELKARLESMRLEAGLRMNLGDVSAKSVPKMSMVAPAKAGGTVATRTFIPHRCHASIGVLGAVSVATACLLPGSPAARLAKLPSHDSRKTLSLEHPSGEVSVIVDCDQDGSIRRAGVLRTARKLFDGLVFPAARAGAG